MKISSVTISGMHHIKNKTYKLEDVNYLHGPNGAGKSTILNAIQLAILGYIPGTAKQTAAIFQHASGPEMKIRVTFDDNRMIERNWRIKGRSIESQLNGSFDAEGIQNIIQDLELPIFNFSELVNLTANKLKDWFINFLPSDSISIDWNSELKNCLGGLEIMDPELLQTALNQLQSEDDKSLIEKIQAFNAAMKNQQSYLKSELTRSESTIQSLIYYDEDGLVGDAAYLDGEIQKAQTQIQKLTADKENLIRAEQIKTSNRQIQSQIDSIVVFPAEEIAKMQEESTSITEKILENQQIVQDLQNRMAEISSRISALRFQISSKDTIINSNGTCPYTNETCQSIRDKISRIQDEIETIQNEISQLDSENITLRIEAEAKLQEIRNLQNKGQRIQNEIIQAQNAEANLNRLQNMLQAVPETGIATLDFYSSEILRLNQQISKIQANKQYNALVDRLTADKYRIENSIEILKCWIKLSDPNGLQTKVMDAPFKNLASEMNKYLSIMFADDIQCNFNLEQKANSFSFGILRNDKYIPYDLLSSGEKTMYALALMICIVNKTSSPLKILIVDDMFDHLDDNRADEVFTALGKLENIQAILAGVKNSENVKSYTIEVTK